MNSDREERMLEAAPLLYKEYCWLDCGSGWDDLIFDLSKNLEQVIFIGVMSSRWGCSDHPFAVRVRERSGFLNFEMNSTPEDMLCIISKFETISSHTCEMCGLTGKLREDDDYYFVRCDKCWNKIEEMSRNILKDVY